MSIIQELRNVIVEAQNKIESIQKQCVHPTECVEKTAAGNTGNPYEADDYWLNCNCTLCEKTWTEEQ